jgi:uncharacterized membrane protein
MFLLDPDRGARRRALARDKSVHVVHRFASLFDKAARDLGYRTGGLVAEARAVVRHEAVTDDILVQRVRSRMGRAVSHPHAVEVSARDGHVTLRGPILAGEVRELLSTVDRVQGVTDVDNQLEVHTRDEAVPALQGERPHPQRATPWSPLLRVAAGALGTALVSFGLSRRDRSGALVAAAGAALLVRDVADRPLRQVLGIGAGRRAVDFHKTITVRAPISDVFAFFSRIENFPRFMSHVKEVQKTGDHRYRWTAAGPAGIPVSWQGEICELTPDRVLAWRSLPGAAVRNAGVARFETNPDGSTRLDIRMSYNPPAGALGHLVASLFGADPKHAMDEDLVRFQSILEQGKTTAHGEEVRFGDLATKPS